MDAQDFRSLQEAYMEVVENQQLDEEKKPLPVDRMKGQSFAHRVKSNDKNISKSLRYHTRANRIDDTLSGKRKPQVSRGKYAEQEREKNKFANRLTRSDKQGIRDSYDYYDIILSHLLDEGYADTQKSAEAIMVNMSEDWREEIMDEAYQEPRFNRKHYLQKLSKRGGMGMGTPEDPHGYRDPGMAKVGAEFVARKTAAAKAKRTGKPDTYRAEKESQSKRR